MSAKSVLKRFWWLLFLLLLVISFAIAVIFKNNSDQESATAQWTQGENGWVAVGAPSPCPSPLNITLPIDISSATSVLYPGQMRSVGYENTAGFRFDGLPNEGVIVKAPLDGEIVRAARFLVEGEVQYVFDIISPCGIMVRFDHLLALPTKLQNIADKLPAPRENDNRSAVVNPPVKILKGEVLATAVGLRNNTFVAWTMFDFRQKNVISNNASWARQHPVMDHYVICPYQYLPEQDQKLIKSLPAADSLSGAKSDFCS